MKFWATLTTLLVLGGSTSILAQKKPAPPTEPKQPKMTILDYRSPRKGQRVRLTRKPPKQITIDLGEEDENRRVDPQYGRLYRGIVPGRKDAWRFHKRWDAKHGTLVTWVGLEPFWEKGRLFIQTQHQPSYRILRPSPKRLIVELDNARVPYRNDRRPIIARVRSRIIDQIVPRQVKGHKVHVIIDLKRSADVRQHTQTVRYRVRSRKRKGRPQTTTLLTRHYIFLDFN